MARFILSEYVEPELTGMWEFIASDNLDAADRFLQSSHDTFLELAKMPGLGRRWNLSGLNLRDLRSFRVRDFENYLVFYRPSTGGIEVLHVLHGARDLEQFWKDK